MRRFYQFGPYCLDPVARSVLCDGHPIPLTPKAVETLRVLVEHGGSIVSKEALLDEVWPGTFVEEGSLTRNISALRRALTNRDGSDGIIETIPRRGYRFQWAVEQRLADDMPAPKTIAILPFAVLGAAAQLEHAGLLIANALITKLSQLRECIVRPTAEVVRYDLAQQGPTAIGTTMGVDYLLHGSIQRTADGVRVTIQLLEARTGTLAWADGFDDLCPDSNCFHDSVSDQIAGALALLLTTE